MASCHCLLLSCLALLIAMAAATQYRVGGPAGWTVPTAMSFNQWVERNRFQIGDSLLFVYPPDRDTVLRVTQDAYSTCNTSSYLQRFDDGNTVFTFDKSGSYYFISGSENNCLRNESMVVVVIADRSNRTSNVPPKMAPSPSPAATLPSSPPSPPPSTPAEVPPPAPSKIPSHSSSAEEVPPPSPSEIPPPLSPSDVPPPPPSAEVTPPSAEVTPPSAEVTPPTPPSAEVTPPPEPTAESSPSPPPPNAASLKVLGFMSSVGALFGSLFFML